ncbi:hypothetical protein BCR33DRAFT_367082 [Rhizoclosmatium globosum]|uniref:Uncharacterized protein n=1 Tax=Rhizoclosmatium globosum TaxID=329046 RepID=A0A1Y2C0C2_9FUNG|nr:hypothetical protein BCR33DRAFT_367082 [Rhizoclosmatium globosum]|eukprot:ORY40493.1 hypothetical protein BCR33DRAFT_367082 [Rhizoclosmatium globosum]
MCRKYGQRELNELLVYILSAVLLLGPVYAAIDAFYQRRTHAFASVHRKWSASMIASIPTILARSIRLSILYSVSYHILFTLLLRRPLYSFFASTVSIFTETVTRNPIVSIPLFSLPSLLELILTTWYIILLWETLYTSLETTYSLPLSHTPTLPLILPPLKSSLSETTPRQPTKPPSYSSTSPESQLALKAAHSATTSSTTCPTLKAGTNSPQPHTQAGSKAKT